MPVIAQVFHHGHTSKLRYTADWTEWLQQDAEVLGEDAIAQSSWQCSDPSVEIGDGSPGFPAPTHFQMTIDGKVRHFATVSIGAAPLNTEFYVTNRIVTVQGKEEEVTFAFVVIDR